MGSLQKIDKELKTALDALEKEKATALKDLDSQVRNPDPLLHCTQSEIYKHLGVPAYPTACPHYGRHLLEAAFRQRFALCD